MYNAIDERFLRGHASEADRQLLAERYLVNHPFLLYTGRISPHKNVVRIIEAFSALKAELEKEELFPGLKLIIIGDELSKHPDLRRTVIRSRMQTDVRFMGFVPIEVLRIFYDAAKIFVFPSLYEGFGLPPLEAMAHGTPVVTSNTSSLPEVVGNAAVLVNPENVFEIMRALHRVLVDQLAARQTQGAGLRAGKTIFLGRLRPADSPRISRGRGKADCQDRSWRTNAVSSRAATLEFGSPPQAFFSSGCPGEFSPKRCSLAAIRVRSASVEAAVWRLLQFGNLFVAGTATANFRTTAGCGHEVLLILLVETSLYQDLAWDIRSVGASGPLVLSGIGSVR